MAKPKDKRYDVGKIPEQDRRTFNALVHGDMALMRGRYKGEGRSIIVHVQEVGGEYIISPVGMLLTLEDTKHLTDPDGVPAVDLRV